MGNDTYSRYLQSVEWSERRRDALHFYGYRCALCNACGVPLEIHHRTYERLGDEDPTDLIPLCEACHGTLHGRIEAGRLEDVTAPWQAELFDRD